MAEQLPVLPVYAITRAELVEIAAEAAQQAVAKMQPVTRNELTTAEAAEYCGFVLADTFRRWAARKHVACISRGRWRRSNLDRAMGGKAA